jgi:hypothetical protein
MTRKQQRFGDWTCFRLQVREGTSTLSGSLERANLNLLDWVLALLRDPNRVGVSLPRLKKETDPVTKHYIS